jgi:hypothetical protein
MTAEGSPSAIAAPRHLPADPAQLPGGDRARTALPLCAVAREVGGGVTLGSFVTARLVRGGDEWNDLNLWFLTWDQATLFGCALLAQPALICSWHPLWTWASKPAKRALAQSGWRPWNGAFSGPQRGAGHDGWGPILGRALLRVRNIETHHDLLVSILVAPYFPATTRRADYLCYDGGAALASADEARFPVAQLLAAVRAPAEAAEDHSGRVSAIAAGSGSILFPELKTAGPTAPPPPVPTRPKPPPGPRFAPPTTPARSANQEAPDRPLSPPMLSMAMAAARGPTGASAPPPPQPAAPTLWPPAHPPRRGGPARPASHALAPSVSHLGL